MELGLGLGFKVYIVTFHAGFNGLLFLSIALAVAEVFVIMANQCHMRLILA